MLDRSPLIDLLNAFMLLTRLPAWRLARPGQSPDLARCVWAFPLVGLVVNAMGGMVYGLAHGVGMPPLLAAAWALATTMVITSAIHEDGLADCADGFGGGDTAARKMEIMRDSRIGSYGALALLLSTTMRLVSIAALAQPAIVLTVLILAGMLGRAGILLVLSALPSARDQGMGASMGRPRGPIVLLGLGLAIVAALVCLPPWPAVGVIVFGFGASVVVAKIAARQIGGYTGDVLGASEVLTECVVLTVMASVFGA